MSSCLASLKTVSFKVRCVFREATRRGVPVITYPRTCLTPSAPLSILDPVSPLCCVLRPTFNLCLVTASVTLFHPPPAFVARPLYPWLLWLRQRELELSHTVRVSQVELHTLQISWRDAGRVHFLESRRHLYAVQPSRYTRSFARRPSSCTQGEFDFESEVFSNNSVPCRVLPPKCLYAGTELTAPPVSSRLLHQVANATTPACKITRLTLHPHHVHGGVPPQGRHRWTKTPCRTKTKTSRRTKTKTPRRTKTKTKTPRRTLPRRDTGLKTRYRKQFNIFFYAPALIPLF